MRAYEEMGRVGWGGVGGREGEGALVMALGEGIGLWKVSRTFRPYPKLPAEKKTGTSIIVGCFEMSDMR